MTGPIKPDLTGVHAKLDRAEEHLDALRAELQSVEFGSYARFEARLNPLDESYSVIMHELRPLPVKRLGVLVGDICHNLRSGLDHLVAALVPPGQVHNRHQFPIFATAADWTNEMQRGKSMLQHVDPAHVAIIESVQPYMRGTGLSRLALLRRFSNADKHRLIHSAAANMAAAPAVTAARRIPAPVTSVSYPPPGQAVTDGSEVARFKTSAFLGVRELPDGSIDIPGVEMDTAMEFQMTVVYGEPGGEDTRAAEFRRALDDIRGLVARF